MTQPITQDTREDLMEARECLAMILGQQHTLPFDEFAKSKAYGLRCAADELLSHLKAAKERIQTEALDRNDWIKVESGQDLIEYTLLMAFIALVSLLIFSAVPR